MHPELTSLAQTIVDSEAQVALAVDQHGAPAASALLQFRRATRVIADTRILHSAAAVAACINSVPSHYSAERVARSLAMAAYQRVVASSPDELGKTFGVSCIVECQEDEPSSSLVYVATQASDFSESVSLSFDAVTREVTNLREFASWCFLHELARHCDSSYETSASLSTDSQNRTHARATPWARQLLLAEHSITPAHRPLPHPKALFPGAFDPLHVGHFEMARHAANRLGHTVAFELCVQNVDKPPLDFIEIEKRLAQFSPEESVWLTRLPTFVEKAVHFPGVTFVVGIDTILRVADPRYYNHCEGEFARAIESIAEKECRFLVFGRLTPRGFQTLEDIRLPAGLAMLCDQVDEIAFRCDISSTQLRGQPPWPI